MGRVSLFVRTADRLNIAQRSYVESEWENLLIQMRQVYLVLLSLIVDVQRNKITNLYCLINLIKLNKY